MQRTVEPQKQQRRDRDRIRSADLAADPADDTTPALDHCPDPNPERAFDAEAARAAAREQQEQPEQEGR
jgi:hypothetical protein